MLSAAILEIMLSGLGDEATMYEYEQVAKEIASHLEPVGHWCNQSNAIHRPNVVHVEGDEEVYRWRK